MKAPERPRSGRPLRKICLTTSVRGKRQPDTAAVPNNGERRASAMEIGLLEFAPMLTFSLLTKENPMATEGTTGNLIASDKESGKAIYHRSCHD
jgi:hypothetical protein